MKCLTRSVDFKFANFVYTEQAVLSMRRSHFGIKLVSRKRYLTVCTNREDSAQHALSRSLIRVCLTRTVAGMRRSHFMIIYMIKKECANRKDLAQHVYLQSLIKVFSIRIQYL